MSSGQLPWYSYYSFSDKIFDDLSRDSLYYKAAQQLSYIGEYEKMLFTWDKQQPKMPDGLTQEQLTHFLKFNPIDAKELILKIAKTERIIIINEAHQQPYHRVFTTSLLHDLYKSGFKYFGAETIFNNDLTVKEIQLKKYPTLTSGYFLPDPLYANLIREAIKEGFEVFAYESTRLGKDDSGGVNLREIEQAKNIKKILDKDPNAKILIHCGWDHIVETPYRGWGKAMAGRLYEYTGINPFTIDQTKLTECSTREYQNPYWNFLDLDYYAMFLDSNGLIFNGPPGYSRYDARVYHPKTKWVNGRPHWLFENNRTAYFIKEKLVVTFPCLIFAFISKEKEETDLAIPFDIIELKSPNDKKALSLIKGQKYTLIIQGQSFKAQKINISVN